MSVIIILLNTMELASRLVLTVWEFFWSLWPKNFYILVFLSALSEAASVTLFKLSGNRGPVTIGAYVLGFLVVAFYAEALRYSKLSQSYPVWLVFIAVLVTVSSYFFLRETISLKWFIGFILAVVGVILIQTSSNLEP